MGEYHVLIVVNRSRNWQKVSDDDVRIVTWLDRPYLHTYTGSFPGHLSQRACALLHVSLAQLLYLQLLSLVSFIFLQLLHAVSHHPILHHNLPPFNSLPHRSGCTETCISLYSFVWTYDDFHPSLFVPLQSCIISNIFQWLRPSPHQVNRKRKAVVTLSQAILKRLIQSSSAFKSCWLR